MEPKPRVTVAPPATTTVTDGEGVVLIAACAWSVVLVPVHVTTPFAVLHAAFALDASTIAPSATDERSILVKVDPRICYPPIVATAESFAPPRTRLPHARSREVGKVGLKAGDDRRLPR